MADWSKAPEWAMVRLAQTGDGSLAWASAWENGAKAQRAAGGPEFELIKRYWAPLETRGAHSATPAEDLAAEWRSLKAEVDKGVERMAEIREELMRRGLDIRIGPCRVDPATLPSIN